MAETVMPVNPLPLSVRQALTEAALN
jgi:hypothetical protein